MAGLLSGSAWLTARQAGTGGKCIGGAHVRDSEPQPLQLCPQYFGANEVASDLPVPVRGDFL